MKFSKEVLLSEYSFWQPQYIAKDHREKNKREESKQLEDENRQWA